MYEEKRSGSCLWLITTHYKFRLSGVSFPRLIDTCVICHTATASALVIIRPRANKSLTLHKGVSISPARFECVHVSWVARRRTPEFFGNLSCASANDPLGIVWCCIVSRAARLNIHLRRSLRIIKTAGGRATL